MPADLAILFATTVTLTVPASGGTDCPSPAQLTVALEAHMPGLVTSAPAPTPATALRLAVTTLSAGDVRFELLDVQGVALLHRLLPAPPRGHDPDCPALAETVALVVERYLHDVGYEAPPLAPPPPRPTPTAPLPPSPTKAIATAGPPPPAPPPRARAVWKVGLSAHGRVGDAGGWDADGDLAVSVEGNAAGRRLGARLSAGVALPIDARWSDSAATQTATLDRLPVRLGLYLRVPLAEGQLEPGAGVGAEALLVTARGPGTASERHLAPFCDVALGYTLSLRGPVYVRGLSRVAFEVPYDFRTFSGARVWGTPRVYGELGVELGFAFR